jgi:hypothetical protein
MTSLTGIMDVGIKYVCSGREHHVTNIMDMRKCFAAAAQPRNNSTS